MSEELLKEVTELVRDAIHSLTVEKFERAEKQVRLLELVIEVWKESNNDK